MAGPELVVRVSANLTELKKALAEGVTQFETTRGALNTMSTAFDGSRIIGQAGAVVGAILQIGDVTKLTAAEQAKANAILQEALEKYRALGREAPPGMTSLAAVLKQNADAAAAVTPKVNDLHAAFNAFDQVLASLGIHIAPEIKGIGELGSASGQTVSQLGLVATAGLMVGAGIGGWKIGRAISEFFDLDTTIGNATAKLLGWGDAAAEAAGSKADALARASARIGFEVLSLSTAMQINGEAQKTWRSNAEISAATVAGWHAEIAKVRENGDLDSLTHDLQSQNFSLQELSKRYDIHAEALQLFQRETKAAADAEKDAAKETERVNKIKLDHLQTEIAANDKLRQVATRTAQEVTKLWDEFNEMASAGGSPFDDQVAAIDRWAADLMAKAQAAGTDTKEFYDALTALWNAKLHAAAQATATAIKETGDVARSVFAEMNDDVMGIASEFDAWNDAIMTVTNSLDGAIQNAEELQKVRDKGNSLDVGHAARDPEIMALLKMGWSLENAESIKMARQWGYTPKLYDEQGNPESAPSKGERVPGYVGGVENAPGGWAMVGERGPELMRVPRGADIYPTGTGPGGGTQVINLVVDGRVLASIVNDVNTRSMKQSRQFPAA
jgi:hypothetical protein